MMNRIIIYSRNPQKMADFYVRHFLFRAVLDPDGRMINLLPKKGGAMLTLHPAAKTQRLGQVLVKLAFDVRKIGAFKTVAAKQGLKFGATWKADGYEFANVKDTNGNSISISSWAFRKT